LPGTLVVGGFPSVFFSAARMDGGALTHRPTTEENSRKKKSLVWARNRRRICFGHFVDLRAGMQFGTIKASICQIQDTKCKHTRPHN